MIIEKVIGHRQTGRTPVLVDRIKNSIHTQSMYIGDSKPHRTVIMVEDIAQLSSMKTILDKWILKEGLGDKVEYVISSDYTVMEHVLLNHGESEGVHLFIDDYSTSILSHRSPFTTTEKCMEHVTYLVLTDLPGKDV